jgi:hypothetical protein
MTLHFFLGRSFFYCDKYNAKPEKNVDSVTIVDRLVDGFKRALDRKKLFEEQNP